MTVLDRLNFGSDGLIPAVVQDTATKQVLMVAYMNRESLQRTLQTGLCTYWSRSRQKIWVKGESSGHVQRVKRILVDCDADCLLIEVEQVGVACHAGYRSCFWRALDPSGNTWEIIAEQEIEPETIYGP